MGALSNQRGMAGRQTGQIRCDGEAVQMIPQPPVQLTAATAAGERDLACCQITHPLREAFVLVLFFGLEA